MIRVLVVDDSAVLRQQLRFILQSDPEVEVVGQAANGEEALAMARMLNPDVITMDIRMPHVDGFEAIRNIMAEHPVPIVVVTGADVERDLKVSATAIGYGAVSVIAKPGAIMGPDFAAQAARVVEQVKLMSGVRVISRPKLRNKPVVTPIETLPMQASRPRTELLAIGASTGGPAALYKLLADFPADLDIPVVVVQHISFGFVEGLAQWLNTGCQVQVRVPEHGDRLVGGTVYVAPDQHHMTVDRFGRIRLSAQDPVGGHRPSVTVLFESVAECYGAKALAAILTGMGADGAEGMVALKRSGARTIAQDEASCVVFGMPREAIARGAIDHIVPLEKIAATMLALRVH